jgi:hypothetical protein
MGKWTDWIYLANSQYIEGNMGFFAACQFPAGMPVGFYIGPEVWRSNKVGGKYPNNNKLEAVLPQTHKEYQVAIRNLDGTMVVYNPEPLERIVLQDRTRNEASVKKPLYMGVHYMNDCSNGMALNSTI